METTLTAIKYSNTTEDNVFGDIEPSKFNYALRVHFAHMIHAPVSQADLCAMKSKL